MKVHFSFTRLLLALTAFVISFTSAVSLTARSFRVGMMPNGNTFSCSNCHLNPGGGGARNAFGEAVRALVTPGGAQPFWSAALAAMDSDGDGVSNGEELGDPEGDGSANRTQNISNPGNSGSTPSVTAPNILSHPQSQNIVQGQSVTFQVQAGGDAPLTYAWSKNGNDLAGEQSATFTISNVTASDEGVYTVRVSNSGGTVTSNQALLSVIIPPQITLQPNAIRQLDGSSASLTVEATGTAPLSFQWFRNDAPVAGATSSTLNFAVLSPNQSGSYRLEVTNSAGSISSEAVLVEVLSLLTINVQPSSLVVNLGEPALFRVMASGAGPLSYQWFKGADPIQGANTSELTIAAAGITDAGNYSVEISDEQNNLRSEIATLTILEPPTILNEPETFVLPLGEAFEFSVRTEGSEPLSYQWQQNGTNLENLTGPQISFETLLAEHAGRYSIEVINQAGSASAEVFVLEMILPPTSVTILTPPILSIGQSLMLEATSNGSPGKSYQWSKNGVIIPGATLAQLTIESVNSIDAGEYRLTVTNEAGSHTSDPVEIIVLAPPAISVNPSSISVGFGETATFEVSVSGSDPIEYQWKFFGANIPGANQAHLVLPSVTEDDLGSYSVEVSNPVGSVTSQAVNLSLRRGPNITSHPVSVETSEGGNATFSVEAVGSGLVTYQWVSGILLLAGKTSPTLTIEQVNASHAGEYSVIVTDSTGTIQSRPAILSVTTLSSHPADLSPTDFVLSSEELIAFQQAWRSGTPWESGLNIISLADVTHATALGINGGSYRLDTRATTHPTDRWEPTSDNAIPINEWVREGHITRWIIPPEQPEGMFKVIIQIRPSEGVQAWAFEETIPDLIVPENIGTSVEWVPSQQKLRWGPFTGDSPMTLVYELSLPVNDLESTLWAGEVSWAGFNQKLEATTILTETATTQGSPAARFTKDNDLIIVSLAVEVDGDYSIEISENLNNWSNLTNTESINRRLIFPDQQEPNPTHRFYRYFLTD